MFIALGQLPQTSPSSSFSNWRLRIAPVQGAVVTKDWSAVATTSDTLAQQAKAAGAIPVMTAALDAKKAALSNENADFIRASVEWLGSVAESEDLASDVDRNLSGQLILQQMGQLTASISSFMAKHSGAYAVWDKLRGGADTSSVMAEVRQVQKMIDMTPLTITGRQQLNARLAQAVASIKPEVDWGTIAVGFGTVGALAAAKWVVGKAQAVTVAHVQKRAGKTKWGQKLGMTDEEEEKAKKKARAKRKRAKAKAEAEAEAE